MVRTVLVRCVDDRGIEKDKEAMGHKQSRGKEEFPCAMLVVGGDDRCGETVERKASLLH
jgi:hypothetical protein